MGRTTRRAKERKEEKAPRKKPRKRPNLPLKPKEKHQHQHLPRRKTLLTNYPQEASIWKSGRDFTPITAKKMQLNGFGIISIANTILFGGVITSTMMSSH